MLKIFIGPNEYGKTYELEKIKKVYWMKNQNVKI